MPARTQKDWDLKQLGAGGAGVLGIVFFLHNAGIQRLTTSQDQGNRIVIEKTVANSARIEKLEHNVEMLNGKIDRGFDALRLQVKAETDKISEILIRSSEQSLSKDEYLVYRTEVKQQIEKLDSEITKIKDSLIKN